MPTLEERDNMKQTNSPEFVESARKLLGLNPIAKMGDLEKIPMDLSEIVAVVASLFEKIAAMQKLALESGLNNIELLKAIEGERGIENAPPQVRAKFTLVEKAEIIGGYRVKLQPVGYRVKIQPVVSGSPENERFFKYTPYGEINFDTVNKDAADSLEVGKNYYVDFTKAE